MPNDFRNSPVEIFKDTLANEKKAKPLFLSNLVSTGVLTFDPSLKLLKEWTLFK